jgi:hypothetical protein
LEELHRHLARSAVQSGGEGGAYAGCLARREAAGRDPNRRVRRVLRGQTASGDQQVVQVAGDQRAVRDVVHGLLGRAVARAPPGRAVDVHGVAALPNCIELGAPGEHILVGKRVVATDAAALADANLRRRRDQVTVAEAGIFDRKNGISIATWRRPSCSARVRSNGLVASTWMTRDVLTLTSFGRGVKKKSRLSRGIGSAASRQMEPKPKTPVSGSRLSQVVW